MCLLVVAWHEDERWPLVVGANRDEWFDRPATAVTVLREDGPRTLGGRDQRAGGTWLAVNEHGVVCGLTNRPLPDGPDLTRRSRGRLPMVAVGARTAEEAADRLAAEVAVGSYNPAWLLVGDRRSLLFVAVEPDRPCEPRPLDPGLHVLENASLGVPSTKVDGVRAVLARAEAAAVPRWGALPTLMSDHTVPTAPSEVPRFPDGRERLVATLAPCVHADGYGTRSSALVRVGADPGLPEMLVADGPPCTAPFVDCRAMWSSSGPP